MCAKKFLLVSMGGLAEGLACADLGARTPIGASGNLYAFLCKNSRKKEHKIFLHSLKMDMPEEFKNVLFNNNNINVYAIATIAEGFLDQN